MALDIAEAAPVEGFATRVTGAADITMAAGADIVVIADRHGKDEWAGDDAVELLRRLNAVSPRAIFLAAGAAARDTVERAVRELRLPRARIFGTAPEALASGARALVALEADASPGDVALAVFGAPPTRTVVPWEDATVKGLSSVRVLDEVARRRIAARLAALWPPGPYALASAAALAVDAAFGCTRRSLSAFVGPDDSMGVRARAVAVQVTLDSGGVVPHQVVPLSARDQVALDNAMLL
jgi:malate dehydrogenase